MMKPEELESIEWLQSHGRAVSANLDVQAGKARLLAGLRREHQDWRPTFRRAHLWQQSLQWALLLLLCFNLGNVSVKLTHVAAFSLPGDALYPVKRGLELARLAFAWNDLRTAELYVGYAAVRSNELEALLLEERYEHMADGVRNLAQTVAQADAALLNLDQPAADSLEQQLDETLAVRSMVVNSLAAVMPPEVRQSAAEVWSRESQP